MQKQKGIEAKEIEIQLPRSKRFRNQLRTLARACAARGMDFEATLNGVIDECLGRHIGIPPVLTVLPDPKPKSKGQ
jgi:hypothetical protein